MVTARAGKKKLAPRSTPPPLTEMQKSREKLLIDLGVTKADIARAVGTANRSNIQGIFRDRFRSLGPDGLEQRVIDYLNKRRKMSDDALGSRREPITRESMGWPEPTNETPAVSSESEAGES